MSGQPAAAADAARSTPATPPASAVTPAHEHGSANPALVVAVLSGVLVSVQSRLNGGLRAELDDTLLAALVSFGGGLAVMLGIVAARPASRAALRRVRAVPWPFRLGGLGGATLVAVSAAAAPVVGVALLTVGLVAGQITGGLAVDRSRLSPAGRHALSPARLGAALICLLAVSLSAAGGEVRTAAPLLLGLVVAAGGLLSVQQALNGRVQRDVGDTPVATLVNFVVGTAALLVGLAGHAVLQGVHADVWPGAGQWYLYVGGPVGAVFVATAAVVVRRLGALRLGLALVSGQLVGAVVLDLVVPLHARSLDQLTLVAVALTLGAVLLSGRAPAGAGRWSRR